MTLKFEKPSVGHLSGTRGYKDWREDRFSENNKRTFTPRILQRVEETLSAHIKNHPPYVLISDSTAPDAPPVLVSSYFGNHKLRYQQKKDSFGVKVFVPIQETGGMLIFDMSNGNGTLSEARLAFLYKYAKSLEAHVLDNNEPVANPAQFTSPIVLDSQSMEGLDLGNAPADLVLDGPSLEKMVSLPATRPLPRLAHDLYSLSQQVKGRNVVKASKRKHLRNPLDKAARVYQQAAHEIRQDVIADFIKNWSAGTFYYRCLNLQNLISSQPTSQDHRVFWKSLQFCLTPTAQETREFRLGAVQSFPFYLTDMIEQQTIWSRIDTGESVTQILADFYGTTSAYIKRLKDRPAAEKSAQSFDEIRDVHLGLTMTDVTESAGNIPLGRLPKATKDLAQQTAIIKLGCAALKLLPESSPEERQQLIERTFKAKTVNKAISVLPSKVSDYGSYFRNIQDFYGSFSRKMLLPYMARQINRREIPVNTEIVSRLNTRATELTSEFLLKDRNIHQLLEMSLHWHRYTSQQHTDLVCTWPSLVKETKTPDGIKIVPLTDTSMLTEEGSNQHHCVGGYSRYCINASRQIFSIRRVEKDPDTGQDTEKILSTLTLNLDVPDRTVSTGCNLSSYNRQACEAAKASATWLCQQINDKKIDTNWPAIEELHAEAQAMNQWGTHSADPFTNTIGFNADSDKHWQVAFRYYKRYLAKSYQKMDDPEEFLAKSGVDKQLIAILESEVAGFSQDNQQYPKTAETKHHLELAGAER